MNPVDTIHRPEIVIGLVGALGTDIDLVETEIRSRLADIGYATQTIRLSQVLAHVPNPPEPVSQAIASAHEAPEDLRIRSLMDAGDRLRESYGRGDALALWAVVEVRRLRESRQSDADSPIYNTAYILKSLKTAEEVATLRAIYGPTFFLLSAYSQRSVRINNLAQRIMRSYGTFSVSDYEARTVELINDDEKETDIPFGQAVRETFWQGDAFVDASPGAPLSAAVGRIFETWFGHGFHTPRPDEYWMFHAQAAAYRSASLGRQVGAVIADPRRSIVAVGANEVPKAGGGSYWDGDAPDARDHVLGRDSSDSMKVDMLGEVLSVLSKKGLLSASAAEINIRNLAEQLLTGKDPALARTQLSNLTEFMRPVHAEMAALTDAARRGVPVDGCTLYVTTFPCHGCARNIVASGIRRVVYVEPYPKSLARNLHADSISVDEAPEGRVRFEPFVGIAPRRYLEFFVIGRRKDELGRVVSHPLTRSMPRIGYWVHELTIIMEKDYLAQLQTVTGKSTLE